MSEYDYLDDTGHYDRRLYNSRIRVSDILYGIGENQEFDKLYFWDVSKEEINNVVQYYKDNRDLFLEMDDKIYDTDCLDNSVDYWYNNKNKF